MSENNFIEPKQAIVNTLILNKKIEHLKQSLIDIFHEEPHIYTALALKSMGLNDEQILDYISDDIKQFNEFNSIKLDEFKIINDNVINNNV